MKVVFSILFITLFLNGNSQYNIEDVDSIHIISYITSNKFRFDTVFITKLDSIFFMRNYVSSESDVPIGSRDKTYPKIFQKEIPLLINSLIGKDTVDFNYGQQMLEQINRFKVNEALKNRGWDFPFVERFMFNKKHKDFVNDLRSIDTFNQYLENRFNTNGYATQTCYKSAFEIHLFTKLDTIIIEGKRPNPLRQPWYFLDKKNKSFEPILNLKINYYLGEILPNYFFDRKSISEADLITDYVRWFANRKNGSGYY